MALISLCKGKAEQPTCDDGKGRQWRNRHGEVREGSWVAFYILFDNPFATAVLTVSVFDVDPSKGKRLTNSNGSDIVDGGC